MQGMESPYCELRFSTLRLNRVASPAIESAQYFYVISLLLWSIVTISLSTLQSCDNFSDYWLAVIAVAWRLPISHIFRQSQNFFHSPPGCFCVFYPISFFFNFSFPPSTFPLLFQFFSKFHSPSVTWNHFGLKVKAQLMVICAVATYLMRVAAHRHFLSLNKLCSRATSLMTSGFPQCILQSTSAKLPQSALGVWVTPPLHLY